TAFFVLILFFSMLSLCYVFGQVSYSVPEEMSKGSLVGKIAQDLGLDLKRLKTGKARLHVGNSAEYIELNKERGVLLIKERIDREALCKQTTPCALHFQMILENPIEFYRVTVEITDINDNAPIFKMNDMVFEISESAVKGSKFILEKALDSDVGINGLKSYSLNPTDNFALKLNDNTDGGKEVEMVLEKPLDREKEEPTDNFVLKIENQADGHKKVEMVLQKPLDREKEEQISLLLNAVDGGDPQMSGTVKIYVTVLDVNDNAPVFTKSVYKAAIAENSQKGTTVTTVSASDADKGTNGDVSYLVSATMDSVSDIFTVNQNGEVILVGEVDFEKIKDFHFRVKAQDGGSPPLSSNVTVTIMIQDQNDNPPQVLYPVQTGGSLVAEMVPRSADVGYLVAKVVAVDVDSGQNAWLSYKLQKATDRALFEVGLQNGEIRTIRQVTDKDAVKQRLTVIVEDNGQPSRSATVIVNVAVADSFPEVLSEFTELTHDKEYNDNLTFYLVLALAVVSFLFITCLVVIISVKIYRWRQSRILYHSNLPVIPYYPPRYSDTLRTGTLPHVYNYEVCKTTDSRKSDCKFGRAGSQNVLIMDPSSTGTMQRIQSEKSILDEPDSPLEVSLMKLQMILNACYFACIVFWRLSES
uniref:Cadherin domain-containing protein n=1 Tax=Oreochromis aureus TaxID=47969 RepID=A0A668U4U1_OREAU